MQEDPTQADATQNQAPQSAENNQHVDIIIAEDDPFISRMYEIKLNHSGYAVVRASNGQEAYKLISTHLPKLVLMDINMPQMTGFEVVTSLHKNNVNLGDVSIVFLTNSTREEDRQTAKSLGCDYIVKADLTPKAVLELIEEKMNK